MNGEQSVKTFDMVSTGIHSELLPLSSHNMFKPKNPSEISSAFVFCCKFLLTLLTNLNTEVNSVDPDQIAPTGAV